MLHLASHSSRHALLPLATSVLQRAVAAELSVSVRRQSSWAKSSSSSSQRRRYQVEVPQRRQQSLQHRPQVNGQAVPFHINELAVAQRVSPSSSSSGAPILAPPRNYDSDLVVVLDMDECLVHSQFLASQGASEYAHQLLQHKTYNTGSAAAENQVESFRFRLPNQGDTVHVHLRPGLSEFLDKVCSRFETHIFTAAKVSLFTC